MKRTMNRLIARLAMLCIAIILGFYAILHAQRGMQERQLADSPELQAESQTATPPMTPIPDVVSTASAPPPMVAVPSAQTPPPLPEPDFAASAQELPPVQQSPVQQSPVVEYHPEPPPRLKPQTPQLPPPVTQDQYESTYGVASDDPRSAEDPGRFAPQDPGAYRVVSNDTDLQAGDSQFAIDAARPQATPSFEPQAAELPPIDELPARPELTLAPPAAPTGEYQGEYQTEPAVPPPSYAVQEYAAQEYAAEDYGPEEDAVQERGVTEFGGGARIDIPDPAARRVDPLRPVDRRFDDATATNNVRGSGRPGPVELEGVQTPTLTVSKSAPQETQVGKPANFSVTVRNVGSIPANGLTVRDEVPQGTALVETDPPASQTPDGAVVWQLGTLEPGREATVMMEVMPQEEGEIGSVATIAFQTSASARTVSTRPQLVLEHEGPPEVLVGEDVLFQIKITNPGTGTAYQVALAEDVPDGLRHFDGRELEYQVGDLRPGETRLLELKLKADKPGIVQNLLTATADAGLSVTDEYQFEVVAPLLEVAVEGPRRRYLERQAAFEITVANPGTAAAKDVQLVAKLPRGLRFMNTNNSGQYDSAAHAVRWSLAELPAKEMGTVALAAMPIQMGEHRIQIETSANMGLKSRTEHQLEVEGLAALLFTVTDVSDPIEVGGQTTYEIHVVNQGSKPATNLRLAALIPPGMEAVNGDGPARVNVEDNRVMFDPLARLAPQADTFYKVHVRGTTAGDKRVQIKLICDEVSEPVTKEESTHVYADQ